MSDFENKNIEYFINWYISQYDIIVNLCEDLGLATPYQTVRALLLNDPAQAERSAQKRFYSDFNTVAELMDFADAKDDNHSGKEVLGGLVVDDSGLVMLNRLPVQPIAQLEGVTDPESGIATAPIYCIDFSYFTPFVHEGYWMIESEPMTDRTQHTSFTVFLDGAHQNLCTNRKKVGFVLHKLH